MVSIITANYNYGRFLDACIKSVLNQTYQDWQLFICDDGSTDNSEEVVDHYADTRIHFRPGPHTGGPAVPRNRGIKASRESEYIAFLDSDDWLTKDSLEKRVTAMERYDLDFISGQTLNVDPTVSVQLKDWLVPYIPAFGFCRMPTVMMKRSLLGRGFDERLKRFEENELFIRLLLTGKPVRKMCLPDVLAYYRIHKDSIVRQRSKMPSEYYDTFERVVHEYAPEFQCNVKSLSPLLAKLDWIGRTKPEVVHA